MSAHFRVCRKQSRYCRSRYRFSAPAFAHNAEHFSAAHCKAHAANTLHCNILRSPEHAERNVQVINTQQRVCRKRFCFYGGSRFCFCTLFLSFEYNGAGIKEIAEGVARKIERKRYNEQQPYRIEQPRIIAQIAERRKISVDKRTPAYSRIAYAET